MQRLKQVELIGTGAMAEVHRGVLSGERGVQKAVAIKRLRPSLRADPEAVELFVNEASITVRLDHPNLVQGLELARDDDGYYLVCEWLDCVTLSEMHEQVGDFGWDAVISIGRALADALSYLHDLKEADGSRLDVVHRDVTPTNVWVTTSGRVKLGDFGVACCGLKPSTVKVREVGTPGFAAPEQSRGEWDHRSDVYGVGATLRAVAGTPPAPLAEVLERATAEDPTQRFADARAFGRALREAGEAIEREAGERSSPDAVRDLVGQVDTVRRTEAVQLDGALQSILGGAFVPDSGPSAPAAREVSSPQVTRARARWPMVLGIIAVIAVIGGFLGTQDAETPVDGAAGAAHGVGTVDESAGGAVAGGAAAGGEPDPNSGSASDGGAAAVGVPGAGAASGSGEAPSAEGSARAAIAPDAGAEPPKVPEATPAPSPAPAPSITRPVKRAPVSYSSVSINAVPWAKVSIDGEERGNTPIKDVQLSAGRHRIKLARAGEPPRSFSIDVVADRAQGFVFDLRRNRVTRKLLPK